MQKAYLKKLYEIAEHNRNVLLLLADSGSGYEALFQRYLPNQIMDFGIAEENMVVAAAGMASCGKIPFLFTAGAFLAYRSMEFIRDDLCLQNHNVKIVGMGTGLGWSTLGPTHHTTEDLGILRSMPGLMVLTPSSPNAASECVRLAYEYHGPAYIRIGMGGEPELYPEDVVLAPGENKILQEGNDIAVFVTGGLAKDVLSAAHILEEQGVSIKVIDAFSIAPFDVECVIQEAKNKRGIVTVEEHSVVGGLGSAVAEILAENRLAINFLRIGLEHGFAKGYGTHQEVKAQNGLDETGIADKILCWVQKEGIVQ